MKSADNFSSCVSGFVTICALCGAVACNAVAFVLAVLPPVVPAVAMGMDTVAPAPLSVVCCVCDAVGCCCSCVVESERAEWRCLPFSSNGGVTCNVLLLIPVVVAVVLFAVNVFACKFAVAAVLNADIVLLFIPPTSAAADAENGPGLVTTGVLKSNFVGGTVPAEAAVVVVVAAVAVVLLVAEMFAPRCHLSAAEAGGAEVCLFCCCCCLFCVGSNAAAAASAPGMPVLSKVSICCFFLTVSVLVLLSVAVIVEVVLFCLFL